MICATRNESETTIHGQQHICYLIETIINQNIFLPANDENSSLLDDNDLNIACSIFDNSTIQCSDILMLRDTVFLYNFHNDVYLLIRNIIELQKYSAL